MTARAGFFIVLLAVILHIPTWGVVALFVVYAGCTEVDNWMTKRAKAKARLEISDELFDWKPDPNDSSSEIRGEVSRIRLVGKDQIIVTRIGDLLMRLV